MLSSEYQETHRVSWDLLHVSGEWVSAVPSDVTMVQEILKENGYATLAVTGGGWVGEKIGFNRGFDEFHEREDLKSSTEQLLEMIEAYMAQGRPIFAFYHTYEIHSPYLPPENYRTLFGEVNSDFAPTNANLLQYRHDTSPLSEADLASLSTLYDAGIRFTDDTLRDTFTRLADTGFLDNYLVIVTGDHGEELGEHGGLLHEAKLYDELIRVPLIIAGNGAPRGVVDQRLASTIDIVPTILRAAALSPLPHMAGRDLLTKPTGLLGNTVAVSQFGNWLYSVRSARWKYIVDKKSGSQELFDLEIDPAERVNVVEDYPDVATRLSTVLADWRTSLRYQERGVGEKRKLSPKEIERLKSLGYIQ